MKTPSELTSVKMASDVFHNVTYCADYLDGFYPNNYQVPAMIGPVIYYDGPIAHEVVIADCDEAADPRLYILIMKDNGEVIADYPHDSPNYR